jgi:selenocysteine-specific elongation factor
MILGLAGHIDHGKTALVRALTGVDTDRLPEEKRRGITIELGFAPLRLDDGITLGVVDVPGHEAFVRTMLAGASGIDLALLVVAADEGVMPQTREHLAILDLLGVRAGVVALTKCDLVDGDWLDLVEEDARALVAGEGDHALAEAPIVRTSASTGDGVDALRRALSDLARHVPPRTDDDVFRMPVDRAFTVKGTGTVVTGTVWSGRLRRDATVRLLPDDRTARVRALQTHGENVEAVSAGARAAVALVGVEVADVPRGTMIASTDAPWQPSRILRGDVELLPSAPAPVGPRTVVRLHVGTSEVGARIVAAGGPIAPGERRPARLALDAPLALRAGDRFVLRGASPPETIGGGVVTDPASAPRSRPLPSVSLDVEQRLALLLREAGASGLDIAALPVRLGVTPSAATTLAAESQRTNASVIAGRLVSHSALDALHDALLADLAAHHAASPLEPGVSLQHVRSRLDAPPVVTDEVLDRAMSNAEVESENGVLRLAGWRPRLSAAERDLSDRLLAMLQQAGSEPPSAAELTLQLGGKSVEPLLRLLERDGRVVQVENDRWYAAAPLADLVQRLRDGMEPGRTYGPAELREFLGFSRKFLIPFLEWCDRTGLTSRSPAGRVLSLTRAQGSGPRA